MADIKIQETITKKLNHLASKIEDMTPAFKDIADYEFTQTKLRFNNEEDPEGKKWPNPFTIRRDGAGSRAQGSNPWGYVVKSNYHAAPPGYHFFDSSRGDKILKDTSTLFNSIGRAYGKDFALVGTNIEYAKKHQEGIGVKQRMFLGINKKTLENVNKTIKFYLMGAVK